MNESNVTSSHIPDNFTFSNFENLSIVCDALMQHSILTNSWFPALLYVAYSSVFLIALFGNGLVCYIVFVDPHMKTVTNYFIVNLAVGDILMDIFCVPTTFISTMILQHWPFGPELCPIVNYAQVVSVIISAYTLVAISIDRYIAIMWPLRPRINKKHAKIAIFAIWLLAVVVSFPILLVSKLTQPSQKHKFCDRFICQEYWPSQRDRYHYTIGLLVVQFFIPLVVLVFTYSSIMIMVCGKRPPGEAENVRDRRMAQSKRKMVRMMVIVVCVFSVCWLPFNILNVAMDIFSHLASWSGIGYRWTGLHWLAMSHTCYNPVIYCWMNARYRNGFITVLHKIPVMGCCIPDRNYHGNTSTAAIPLTALDGQNNYGLRRINTCTTYVSVKKNLTSNNNMSTRSASFRCAPSSNNSISIQRCANQPKSQRESSI